MEADFLKQQLINELPYPLGLLVRNLYRNHLFLLETGQEEELRKSLYAFNYGLSHFLALLNLKQYLTEDPLRSSNLNKQVLQTFRGRHAVRWQVLLIQNLTKIGFHPFIQELKSVLQKPVPIELVAPFQEDETLNEDAISILTYFLEIPSSCSAMLLKDYFRLVEFILKEYSFLTEYHLIVPEQGSVWVCKGTLPKKTKMNFGIKWTPEMEGRVLLVSKTQQVLDLYPFVIFKKQDDIPELHFLHQEVNNRVSYLGHGLQSLHLDNELETCILASYQRMVTDLRNFSLTTRVYRAFKPSEPPIKALSRQNLAQFIGRTTEIQSIKDFIQKQEKCYGLIFGPSGIGKTALLCKLFSENQKNYFWYFHQSSGESNTPEDFYQSVLGQLKSTFQFKTHIPNNLKELRITFWEMATRCAQLLQQENKKLVFFVDGLNDQIEEEGIESTLEYLPKKLPENTLILLVLQQRPGQDILQSVNLAHLEERIHFIRGLDPLQGLEGNAFFTVLTSQLASFSFPKETQEHLLHLIGGTEQRINPLYLNLVQRWLENSEKKRPHFYHFPKNEKECFLLLWNQLPPTDDGIAFRFLALLSLMREKGTDEIFSRLFHKSQDYINSLSLQIKPFLTSEEDGYQIVHSRLKQLILEQFQPSEIACFHGQLARFYDKPEEQAWFQVENISTFHYLTYHLYYHFVFSKNSIRYLEVIEDPSYNREKERRVRVFQYVLEELKYTIKLFLAENNLPKLIRYGFKYNNIKSYREKGLRELPYLLQNFQYLQVLQIFNSLESIQSKRLGVLYLTYLAAEQKRIEFDHFLSSLISLSPLGFVLELRAFYVPLVKKLVARNIPELLHFNYKLPQIHLKILSMLPEEKTELSSEKFYFHIHQLLQPYQKVLDVSLYESLLCLIVTSEFDEHFEKYMIQAEKCLSCYGAYIPIDLGSFLLKLGRLFYQRGFQNEIVKVSSWLENYFPIEDQSLVDQSNLTDLHKERESIRKILLVEACRLKAYQWLSQEYFLQLSQLESLSYYTFEEIEEILSAVHSIEEVLLQYQILRYLLDALEAYITPEHSYKVKILEKIYTQFFQENTPSVELLVRMCQIYQESARNAQYEYTDEILLKLCLLLKERSRPALEKVIDGEYQRRKNFDLSQFAYELNVLVKNTERFRPINIVARNRFLVEWIEDESHYENLNFEKFPEYILLLKRVDVTETVLAQRISQALQKMLNAQSIRSRLHFEYLPLFFWVPKLTREFFKYQLYTESEQLIDLTINQLKRIESVQKQKKAIEHFMEGLLCFTDGDDKLLRLIQKLFNVAVAFENLKNQSFFLVQLFQICTQVKSVDLKNTLILDARETIATHPIPEVRYTIFAALTSADIDESLKMNCFIASLIEREKIKQLRTRYYYLLGLAQQLLRLNNIEKAIEIFLRVGEDIRKLPASEKKCRLLAELASGFYKSLQFDLLEANLEEYYHCALQLDEKQLSIDLLFKAMTLIAQFEHFPQIETLFDHAVKQVRNVIREKTEVEQAVIFASLGKHLVRLGQTKQGEDAFCEGLPLLERVNLAKDKDAEEKIASAIEKIMYEAISTRHTDLIERIVTLLSQKYEEGFFYRNYGYFQKHRALVLSSFGEAYFRIKRLKESQHFIELAMQNLKEIESFDFAGETYILICKKLLSMGMENSKHYDKALTKAITFIKKTPDENLRYKRIEDFARILTGMDAQEVVVKRISSLTTIASNIYDPEIRDKCLAAIARALCQTGHLEMASDLLKSDISSKYLFLPDYVLALASQNPTEALSMLNYITNLGQKWDIVRKLANQFENKKEIEHLKHLAVLAVEDSETIDFVFYKLLHSLEDKEIIEELKNRYLTE